MIAPCGTSGFERRRWSPCRHIRTVVRRTRHRPSEAEEEIKNIKIRHKKEIQKEKQ